MTEFDTTFINDNLSVLSVWSVLKLGCFSSVSIINIETIYAKYQLLRAFIDPTIGLSICL